MIKKEVKKGQVTIFIIIAVLIVALGVLIYIYYPKIISTISPETKNPLGFIQECMEEEIEDTIEIISLQGGDYVVNENTGKFYIGDREESYKGHEDEGTYVKYICYTNEDFAPCINQEPFLTENFELEILNAIIPEIENCFNSLVTSYKNKGYDVTLKKGNPEVQILPNVISTKFNRTLSLVKGEESENYENFEINLNSNLYEILGVAKNIIIWEKEVGDSLQEAYMYDNPYLRIEKHRKEDEVKIYVIKDRNTEEVFRFAVRSFAAPVGFSS